MPSVVPRVFRELTFTRGIFTQRCAISRDPRWTDSRPKRTAHREASEIVHTSVRRHEKTRLRHGVSFPGTLLTDFGSAQFEMTDYAEGVR